MKKIKICFLVVILVIVSLPVIYFNFIPNSISEIDNRYLQEIPLGVESDDTSIWESYINDRIGFRDNAISAYTSLNDDLFHEMVHPTYEYGKDDYVFFKLGMNSRDTEFIDEYVLFLTKIQNYCFEKNVPFIYVINPSKTTIYSQYLPSGYNYRNSNMDYFVHKLNELNINYIDNTSLLLEKSKKEQVFNRQYDAGHWNDLGAYYGINNIIKKMQEYYPKIEINSLDMFNKNTLTAASLLVSKLVFNENNPQYTLKNDISSNIINVSENYANSIKLDTNYKTFSFRKNENANNDIRAMYFQGSYLNTRVQMTWPSVKECVNIHGYQNVIDFDYYFNIFQPDIVVFESAEYATTRNYYDINNLKNKEFNPMIETNQCIIGNEKIKVSKDEFVYHLQLKTKKKSYAYIKMNNKVFDLLWDDEKQIYYADIDKSDYDKNYSIYYIE